MKLTKPILLGVVTLLLTSCGSLGNLRKPPSDNQVYVCPESAFVDIQKYEIDGPKDSADFLRFVTELAKKYPNLKIAYTDLYNCWVHYHGEPK